MEPKELREVLDRDGEARRWWNSLTPAQRRMACTWIDHAKGGEVRAHRVADVLRRARRAFNKEGAFYPTKADQPLLSLPKNRRRRQGE